MAAPVLKASVKNSVVRPIDVSDPDALLGIEYRWDPAESWRNGLVTPLVVLPAAYQDARLDVRHSLRISFDPKTIEALGFGLADLDIVVLVRDNFSKQIKTLLRESLAKQQAFLLDVKRSDLETTALTRRVDFEVMVVTNKEIKLKKQEVSIGARLVKKTISVSTESSGLIFNYSRTTSEEFFNLGLPRSTTFHVQIESGASVVKACDDIASVFKVLVHEDAWTTLQEIRAGDKLGEALGTMLMADMIFNLVAAAQEECEAAQSVEDTSILNRILTWLSDPLKTEVSVLAEELFSRDGTLLTHARIQEAVRLTRTVKRVNLADGDGE